MRHWWRRNWLKLWLAVCAVLLIAAPLKRHANCIALGDVLAQQLEDNAYQYLLLDAYLWGDYSSGRRAVQGPAIWLLGQGYENPRLLKMLLLAEGERLYEHIYTYPRCMNADLRRGLIRRCREHFTHDPDVDCASGALALAMGDVQQAREALGAAWRAWSQQDAAPPQRRLPLRQLLSAPNQRHLLGRYCAALTLSGEDAKAGELLREQYEQYPQEGNFCWLYAHWLQDHGEYAASLAPTLAGRRATAQGDWDWLERNARLHGGSAELYLETLDRQAQRLDAATGAPQVAQGSWFPSAEADPIRAVARELRAALRDPAAGSDPDSLWRLYLLSADPGQLDRLAALAAQLDRQWPGAEADWHALELWNWRRFRTGLWLATGLCREQRWDAAQAQLRRIGPDMLWESAAARDWQEQELLCRIALGQALDAPIEPRRGIDNRNEWDPQWRPRADASTNAPAGDEWIDTSLLQQAGPFNALRDGDRLTALLRSPQFAAALEHSGRSLEDALPEILRVTQPALERYSDWSNGELPDGW